MGNNNMYYNGRRYSHNRGNADCANSETCTECAAQRNSAPETNENDASCKELMRAIMEADFVAQDLKLYACRGNVPRGGTPIQGVQGDVRGYVLSAERHSGGQKQHMGLARRHIPAVIVRR